MVFELQFLNPLGAGQDVIQRGHEDARVQAGVDPVVHLDQDRGRDEQGLIDGLDEPSAGRVVGVAPVERCVERPCVEDQRHGRGIGRSSAVRRAVSWWPESPMPRLFGFGR